MFMIPFLVYIIAIQVVLSLVGMVLSLKNAKLFVTPSIPWALVSFAFFLMTIDRVIPLFQINKVVIVSIIYGVSFWCQLGLRFFITVVFTVATVYFYLLLTHRFGNLPKP